MQYKKNAFTFTNCDIDAESTHWHSNHILISIRQNLVKHAVMLFSVHLIANVMYIQIEHMTVNVSKYINTCTLF